MSSFSLAREMSQVNHWGSGPGGVSLGEENSPELIAVFMMTSPTGKHFRSVPVTLSVEKSSYFRLLCCSEPSASHSAKNSLEVRVPYRIFNLVPPEGLAQSRAQNPAERGHRSSKRIRHMISRYLLFTALISALGGLLFGYDWVVIGGANPFYDAYFNLVQPTQEAWAMSCALVGCLVGAVSSGYLSEQLGRKRALLISATVFVVSSFGTGTASTFGLFVAWRISGRG